MLAHMHTNKLYTRNKYITLLEPRLFPGHGRLTLKISAPLSLAVDICDPLASISIDLWTIVIGPRDHVDLLGYVCTRDLPLHRQSQAIS